MKQDSDFIRNVFIFIVILIISIYECADISVCTIRKGRDITSQLQIITHKPRYTIHEIIFTLENHKPSPKIILDKYKKFDPKKDHKVISNKINVNNLLISGIYRPMFMGRLYTTSHTALVNSCYGFT